MNKKNSQKRTLGASHVPGGFHHGTVQSSGLTKNPPGTAQDFSDSLERQPSSLRYDPYGALGLTLALDLAPNATVQKLLATAPSLIFVTFAGFFVLFLILRCKQVCVESKNSTPNRTLLERGVMLADQIKESNHRELIEDNLESKVENWREDLERIFCSDSLSASAQEGVNEIREIHGRLSQVKDNVEKQLELLKQLETRTSSFIKKLKPHLEPETGKRLESFRQDIKATHDITLVIHSIARQINEEKVKFKELARDFGGIADFIDDSHISLDCADSLAFLVTLAWNLAFTQRPKGKREQKYWREARHAAAYILQKREAVKLARQDMENPEKLSYEELTQLWDREFDEDEIRETSEFLRQTLQSDSSS